MRIFLGQGVRNLCEMGLEVGGDPPASGVLVNEVVASLCGWGSAVWVDLLLICLSFFNSFTTILFGVARWGH